MAFRRNGIVLTVKVSAVRSPDWSGPDRDHSIYTARNGLIRYVDRGVPKY